jgi:hypothetical protein
MYCKVLIVHVVSSGHREIAKRLLGNFVLIIIVEKLEQWPRNVQMKAQSQCY